MLDLYTLAIFTIGFVLGYVASKLTPTKWR